MRLLSYSPCCLSPSRIPPNLFPSLLSTFPYLAHAHLALAVMHIPCLGEEAAFTNAIVNLHASIPRRCGRGRVGGRERESEGGAGDDEEEEKEGGHEGGRPSGPAAAAAAGPAAPREGRRGGGGGGGEGAVVRGGEEEREQHGFAAVVR